MHGSQELLDAVRMREAICRGNYGIAECAPDRFPCCPTKGALGLGIPRCDCTVGIHADESIISRLQNHAVAFGFLPQHLLAVLQRGYVSRGTPDSYHLPATVKHPDLGS